MSSVFRHNCVYAWIKSHSLFSLFSGECYESETECFYLEDESFLVSVKNDN